MHTIFSVTAKDIELLNDAQARELVARLCRAELRSLGTSPSTVTWGGDQRAKDGGIDVRVDSEGPLSSHGYIFSGKVGFQVKAEKFGPAKIPKEMAPNNTIRKSILGLAETSGAYVIVSTRDNLSDDSLKLRTDAMRECLNSFGIGTTLEVDFYDARKIADWVETLPAISNWVKNQLDKPNVGWRSYGPWAYHENSVEAEYLIDDRVKVFAPNQDDGLSITNAIEEMRKDLTKNASVRIVGLSGVGKTRLAQALFDTRIKTPTAALDDQNVIYTDLSDNPTPQPSAMLEALLSSKADSVVIVDNCGPETHQRLTEIAKRRGSGIKLLTIEYDIRDDLPEATIVYRLEGSSDEVIKSLLKRRYTFLSNLDLQNIAEFSGGNARIAFALASTASAGNEIGRLRDEQLFKRLFHQTNAESDELLRCAEVLSLLYSFNGEVSGEDSELQILATLAETTVSSLQRKISELQRRGLLQSRGPWRAILPHAIANRLAMRALSDISTGVVDRTFCEAGSDRTAKSFSRRLSYLHTSEHSQRISKSWLVPGGRLGDLPALNDLGRQMFANIAAVTQNEALEALERAVDNPAFVSVDNRNRSEFARVALSLAYEPEFFERAVEVLIKFSVVELENYNQDPVAKKLSSLFYIHLSGTHASLQQRLSATSKLLESTTKILQKFGLSLVDAALESTHFSSTQGFDFGARKRDYGWWPKTIAEVQEWYDAFIKLAVKWGNSNDAYISAEIRVSLGDAARGLTTHGGVIDALVDAAQELNSHRAWPEGWLGIRRILTWDKDKVDKDDLAKVLRLEKILAPTNLKDRIVAKVLARGTFAYDLDDSDDDDDGGIEDASSRYAKSEQEAKDLGKLAAVQDGLIEEILSDLLHDGSNSKVWSFGVGVGSEYNGTAKLFQKIRSFIASLGDSRFSPVFIRGLIFGWSQMDLPAVNLFMAEALIDDVWRKWFIELQVRVELDDLSFDRILQSVEMGHVPAWQYKNLAMGRVTDPLTVDQITRVASRIANMPTEGLQVSVDLMGMVIFCAVEKDEEYRQTLALACERFLSNVDWKKYPSSDESTDHDMEVVLNFTLSYAVFSKSIACTLENLIDRGRTALRRSVRNRGRLLAPFFRYFPVEALDAVYVPDEQGQYYSALQLISDPYRENSETAIRKVPDEKLVEWCDKSPEDRYVFAAQACRLLSKQMNGSGAEEITISTTSIQILERAPNAKLVLEIFLDRFQPRSWSGRLADILQSRLPLLQKLNPKNDQNLQVEINIGYAEMEKKIAAWKKSDEDSERSRTGSFE
jgi:hypothetical protein